MFVCNRCFRKEAHLLAVRFCMAAPFQHATPVHVAATAILAEDHGLIRANRRVSECMDREKSGLPSPTVVLLLPSLSMPLTRSSLQNTIPVRQTELTQSRTGRWDRTRLQADVETQPRARSRPRPGSAVPHGQAEPAAIPHPCERDRAKRRLSLMAKIVE